MKDLLKEKLFDKFYEVCKKDNDNNVKEALCSLITDAYIDDEYKKYEEQRMAEEQNYQVCYLDMAINEKHFRGFETKEEADEYAKTAWLVGCPAVMIKARVSDTYSRWEMK